MSHDLLVQEAYWSLIKGYCLNLVPRVSHLTAPLGTRLLSVVSGLVPTTREKFEIKGFFLKTRTNQLFTVHTAREEFKT